MGRNPGISPGFEPGMVRPRKRDWVRLERTLATGINSGNRSEFRVRASVVLPWEDGALGIAYLRSDRAVGAREARSDDPDIPELLAKLPFEQQRLLLEHFEQSALAEVKFPEAL